MVADWQGLGRGSLRVSDRISGASAAAQGAIESGVSLVTGYPGAPATYVFEAILEQSDLEQIRLEWTTNEKCAIEIAYGASLAGIRSLLCIKSVGVNIALDPLMSLILAGCNAGLVILAGDDPGGWGSQNEQDSRLLALAAEIPLLEPTTVADARSAMREAFRISESLSLPVMVRITRALALADAPIEKQELLEHMPSDPVPFEREYMRWVVLPINVVPYHARHLKKLDDLQDSFECSGLNGTEGEGTFGVVAAGFLYQKLLDALAGEIPPVLRVLRLGTVYPFPKRIIQEFAQSIETILVLEETAPVVERLAKEAIQETSRSIPVIGRESGHVERVGEIFSPQISNALKRLIPHLALPIVKDVSRERPSLMPLCEGCPYIPTFYALLKVMENNGGRENFIVTGDPGCMVRAQQPPYELMDVKNSLGSGIGMAVGIALGLAKQGDEKKVVALCGDSGLLHTGLQGLVDAVQFGINITVLILDNGTTALSGGQPHPGSRVDVRGGLRPQIDLEEMVRATGVQFLQVVDLDRNEEIQPAIEKGISSEGISVVIARGQCVFY